jgi:3,4-dihydroxy 2-butanone 4-phosphate synthase/GTP cyclohydrolase II
MQDMRSGWVTSIAKGSSTDWDTGPLATAEELIAEAKAGRMFILVDDEDRENEGDLVMCAQFATPAAINFMATHGRGLICVTIVEDRALRLALPMMAPRNGDSMGTAFTVSVDARRGITTGISAHDRASTIATLIATDTTPNDLVTPGHMFPLIARNGGVLEREGHTEASVDIARMAGVTPAGVICEILNEDGTMARLPDLIPYARHHKLKLGTIASLIAYRLRTEGANTQSLQSLSRMAPPPRKQLAQTA